MEKIILVFIGMNAAIGFGTLLGGLYVLGQAYLERRRYARVRKQIMDDLRMSELRYLARLEKARHITRRLIDEALEAAKKQKEE